MTLSLLKVSMLDCMIVDVAFHPLDSLGGNWLRVFEPRLPLVGWALWCGQVLRSGPMRSWYMSLHQPFPPTSQACDLELSFSLGRLSVSAHSQFCKAANVFTRVLLKCLTPTWTNSAQLPPPAPPGREEMFPLVFSHQFCPGGVRSAPQLR
jgi:hypothetical protein